MPAVGDQHKPNGLATSNPFEEQPLRITEYTAQEIATLQSRLDKQLGPEYISSRAGPGGSKVHYLAADKAISLANEVFGFNGWSSSIRNIQIDFVDENAQTGKISLGLSVIVRITLKDGTHHEDIGYGQIDNCKGKAAAFEKAKKEGTTDALKRALRNFGNVLGNCVYDKSYVQKVTKLKVGAAKWDESMLYRHADFAPKKEPAERKRRLSASAPEAASAATNPSLTVATAQEETAEFEDSFELADFEEMDFHEGNTGHPDEIALPAEPAEVTHKPATSDSEGILPPPRPEFNIPSKSEVASMYFPRAPAVRPPQLSGPTGITPQPLPGQRGQAPTAARAKPSGDDPRLSSEAIARQRSPDQSSNALAPPIPGQVMGFYSAKAADSLDGNNSVITGCAAAVARFNPHAESPSIRKTSGVNHNRSAPLKRDLSVDTTPIRRDPLNLPAEQLKKVGAFGANGPLPGIRGASTSAYRPPTRRGAVDTSAGQNPHAGESGGVDRGLQAAARRTPLGDVSNMQHHVTAITTDGADAKRQRVTDLSDGQLADAGATNQQPSHGDG